MNGNSSCVAIDRPSADNAAVMLATQKTGALEALRRAGIDRGSAREAVLIAIGELPGLPPVRVPRPTPAGTMDRPALSVEMLDRERGRHCAGAMSTYRSHVCATGLTGGRCPGSSQPASSGSLPSSASTTTSFIRCSGTIATRWGGGRRCWHQVSSRSAFRDPPSRPYRSRDRPVVGHGPASSPSPTAGALGSRTAGVDWSTAGSGSAPVTDRGAPEL